MKEEVAEHPWASAEFRAALLSVAMAALMSVS
jgi:hypothetical protein